MKSLIKSIIRYLMITLNDLETGRPLAHMSVNLLSAIHTGAAACMAARSADIVSETASVEAHRYETFHSGWCKPGSVFITSASMEMPDGGYGQRLH